MSLKTRVIFTSELNPPIIIKDDFGGDAPDTTATGRAGSALLSKLIRPRFDILLDYNGIELREVYAPEGEPTPGRLGFLLIGLVLVFFLLLVVKKRG